MAAVASVTAQAEIELAEGFSLQGFLDVSASSSDVDGKDTKSTAEIGEFEVDFLYGGDSINAQVDLNYTDSSGGVDLEQAFVGFSVSEQFSLTAGKFLSSIGYETYDVNGLNQYSHAASTAGIYPGHHTGLAGFTVARHLVSTAPWWMAPGVRMAIRTTSVTRCRFSPLRRRD